MNYYTATIPLPLAEKLKEKGYPQDHDAHHLLANGTIYDAFWATAIELVEIENALDLGTLVSIPFYSEVFDWLMSEKNTNIYFDKDRWMWSVFIENESNPVSNCEYLQGYSTWHEAANAAIEKALELI